MSFFFPRSLSFPAELRPVPPRIRLLRLRAGQAGVAGEEVHKRRRVPSGRQSEQFPTKIKLLINKLNYQFKLNVGVCVWPLWRLCLCSIWRRIPVWPKEEEVEEEEKGLVIVGEGQWSRVVLPGEVS